MLLTNLKVNGCLHDYSVGSGIVITLAKKKEDASASIDSSSVPNSSSVKSKEVKPSSPKIIKDESIFWEKISGIIKEHVGSENEAQKMMIHFKSYEK